MITVAAVMHVYEVRPRKDKRGVDLISDALPFGRLWYGEPNAISNAARHLYHLCRRCRWAAHSNASWCRLASCAAFRC